jgi:ribonuclease HII
MTQFNVSVIGSLQNGYTATAEKIANSVSHVSNAPVKGQPVEGQPIEGQPVQASVPALTQEEQRAKFTASVKNAANMARTAAAKIVELWGAAGRGMQINSNSFTAADNAMAAANVAVNAASNAVKNAKEAVKTGIVNNEVKDTMANALTMSKDAKTAVNNAVNAINAVKDVKMKEGNISTPSLQNSVNAVKEVKMKEGNASSPSIQNAVIMAKKATESAMKIWENLDNTMGGMSKGGRYTHRKHTQRKRKHHKRYTARK